MLGSHRPTGTPDNVTGDDDPRRLLEKIRAANRGGDVHLIGGPATIETYRALGKLELVILPFPRTALEFESSRPLDGGAVEIIYRVLPQH
ncbi:hypothetical protein [Nocardia wallacei]|uniref:hypothetical protein n=1 Tax=Nocardia wallacei TaxID=480035 RepID=UPI002458C60E|nr:hypothetical protein [Nocardia wallacei]